MSQARTESSNAAAAPASAERIGVAGWAPAIVCALAGWGVLSWYLGAEWSLSEQYNYGWFVPLLAAGLFWLRWPDRPAARAPSPGRAAGLGLVALVVVALLLLPFVRLVEVANPEWRLLGWVHALLVVALTLAAIWRAGGWPWIQHFAFPVLFFLVAVPWTRGFEDLVIQQLMRGVAEVAVDAVALLGVPAVAEGNLIRIGAGVVGVNEACSGVRSLQTSLMFGLLLGELNRFSVGRRVVVVLGAVAVALLANTIRATYLVWIAAQRGLGAVEQQHDVIGYLILITVFVGTLGLAEWLKRGVAPPRAKSPPAVPPAPAAFAPAWVFLLVAGWILGTEIGVEAWYRAHERGLGATPRWSVHWPTEAPGFRDNPIAERATRILRYDEGRGARWSAQPDGPSNRIAYFFRWKPGRNSAQLAADHRPDVCLPASGLQQVADRGRRAWSVAPGHPGVVFQHYEFARPGVGRKQAFDVFYCLAEDVPRADLAFNPYVSSGVWDHIEKRIRVALAGRRNLGQQMLEVVVLDAESAGEAEREFARLLPELVRFPGGD